MPRNPDKLRCHARSKRTHEQCKGYATPGKKVCYQHGGAPNVGRPPVHGRYSKALERHPVVQAAYERHKDDPALMETLNEIAVLRAWFECYLDKWGDIQHPASDEEVRGFVADITKAVERRHKMLYGEQITITERDFQALATRVVDLVRTIYGDGDERWQRFTAEITKLGGKGD